MKKCIKSDLLFKLASNGQIVRPFCWHQNVVLKWLSAPALRLCMCIKSWKICTKSDFKEIFFQTCNVWLKWQDQNFVPVDYLTCYISWKKLYTKLDFKEIAKNGRNQEAFLLPPTFCHKDPALVLSFVRKVVRSRSIAIEPKKSAKIALFVLQK